MSSAQTAVPAEALGAAWVGVVVQCVGRLRRAGRWRWASVLGIRAERVGVGCQLDMVGVAVAASAGGAGEMRGRALLY